MDVDAVANLFGIHSLHFEQRRAVTHFLNGKDVFIVLPTGFGKSFCFQCLPLCLGGDTVIIVISPLIALIKDQVQDLRSKGLSAGFIIGEDDCEEMKSGVKKGSFQLVYFTPESILLRKKYRKMISSEVYQKRIRGLVIDEAHTVKKWGMSFRDTLMNLGEVRSIVPEGTPLMALTATATTALRHQLANILGMKNPESVILPPCKPNLTYEVNKFSSISDNFSALLSKLQKERTTFPKTIIYCRKIVECADLYIFFKMGMKSEFTEPIGAPDLSQFRLVEMFTSCTDIEVKNQIIASFTQTECTLRIVCATIAFGMGINCPNVRQVIHVGAPDDIESYIQETGRAGRDGLQANALLLKKSSMQHLDEDIKSYVSVRDCRRKLLFTKMEGYNSVAHFVHPSICCDYCMNLL